MPILKRKKLFTDVWRQAPGPLARKLGITPAKLRDICKKMAIPLPPAEYWAQLKAGTAPEPPELEPHDGLVEFDTSPKPKESLVEWMLRTAAEDSTSPSSSKPRATARKAAPPSPAARTAKPLPRMIPLSAWAELMFGEYAPHKNTLLRWVHEGRIQPQPMRIGKGFMVKPDAEYRGD